VSCIAVTPAFCTAEPDRGHAEPLGLSGWEPQLPLSTLKNLLEERLGGGSAMIDATGSLQDDESATLLRRRRKV